MRVLIDADGCPVVDLAIEVAGTYQLECILLCDTAHYFNRAGARTIVLGQGADSVDFALVNMVQPGDLVVTQDYGLAAMCLAKRCLVLNQNGMEYHEGNIDSLLASRHIGQKIRRGGGRTKGPAKRTKEQDEMFVKQLHKLILSGINNDIADSAIGQNT